MEIVAMPYFPPKTTLQITSLEINLKKSHRSLGTQELRSPVLGKSRISGPTKVLGQYVGHGQVADSGRLIDRKCASQLLTGQDEQHNQRSHNNAPPHPDHPQKYAVSAQHNKMRLANTNLCTSMHLPRLKHIRLHQKGVEITPRVTQSTMLALRTLLPESMLMLEERCFPLSSELKKRVLT